MDDSSHLLEYRRFFGVLFSVLPGLELTYGLSAFMLWLFCDAIGVEWGVGIGIAGSTFVLTLGGWLFVGMGIQKWVEDKSAGFLFLISSPFILIMLVFMGWLFVETVLGAESPGAAAPAAGHARLLIEQARALLG